MYSAPTGAGAAQRWPAWDILDGAGDRGNPARVGRPGFLHVTGRPRSNPKARWHRRPAVKGLGETGSQRHPRHDLGLACRAGAGQVERSHLGGLLAGTAPRLRATPSQKPEVCRTDLRRITLGDPRAWGARDLDDSRSRPRRPGKL